MKFIQAYLSHKNHSLHVQKNHLILGKQLAGTQLLSRQSRQATAAAGGLLIGIKQLWRPATLWELGDVAGPPPPAPHLLSRQGLGASSGWILGCAPLWRQSTSWGVGMGSAVFGLDLDWVPLNASVPKKRQNSFSHQKNG